MKVERVILVDHLAERRKDLKELLLKINVEVLETDSSLEALSLLAREEVSLILTETELPGKSGLYLLKESKKKCPEVEVILISHNAASFNLLQALRHGAYDFIIRPIDSEEILASTLSKAFSQVRLRRQNQRLLLELEAKNRILEHSLKMLETLTESIELFATSTEIEDLFKKLLHCAVRELEAQRGLLILQDKSGRLALKVSQGLEAKLTSELAGGIPVGLIREIATRAKPTLVPGEIPAALQKYLSEMEKTQLLRTPGLLAAPLRIKDRVAGLVLLSGSPQGRSFSQPELQFLIQLCHHAGLALEKAGIIYQLKRSGAKAAAN